MGLPFLNIAGSCLPLRRRSRAGRTEAVQKDCGSAEALTPPAIIVCIRYNLGLACASDVVQAFRDFRNWPALVRTAERHGLLPLISDCLDSCGVSVPEAELHRALRLNAKRVMLMTEELNRVFRRLEAAGVPTIAFKGPVSASALYDEPAHRVFCDLDLLVAREHVMHARSILCDCGYRASGSPHVATARERNLFRFTELSLENPANGIQIDLHWELTPADWFIAMPSGIWERTRTMLIDGQSVRTLGEEDTFLHLSIHGGKHGWSNLTWLVDLCSLILRSRGIAERSLRLIDGESGIAGMVRVAQAAAAVILPDLPVRMELTEKTIGAALAGTMAEETFLSRLEFQWRIGGNRAAICRFLLKRLFTPNEDDWNSLPARHPRLLFLLVPWRLLRLTRNCTAAIIG